MKLYRLVRIVLYTVLPVALWVAPAANAQTDTTQSYWGAPLPSQCAANQECIKDETTGAVFTGEGALLSAFGALTQDGDVLIGWPAIYDENDATTGYGFTLGCAAPGPTLAALGTPCISDPAYYWVLHGTGMHNALPNGTVGKGAIVIGTLATVPTAQINDWYFRNATNGVGHTVGGTTCNVAAIADGQPNQCTDSNVGCVRIQDGNVIEVNLFFTHCANSNLAEPNQWGNGSLKIYNSIAFYGGTTIGQQHGLAYCSRFYLCATYNSIALDTWFGNAFKNRGYTATLANDVFGDAAACPSQYQLQWAPDQTIGGNGPDLGTSNEVNIPDGGTVSETNLILCKSALGATSNHAFQDWDAFSVYGWPNPTFTAAGNVYYNQDGNAQLIWNPMVNANLSSTGDAINGSAPEFTVEGLGTMSGPTLNGSGFSPSHSINYPAATQGAGLNTLDDRRGSSGPQNITIEPNHTNVLGGPGLMTVSPGTGIDEIYAGSGGVHYNGAGTYFIDAAGDAPSTIVATQDVNTLLAADGDSLTQTTACKSGSFIMLVGRNLTVNECSGGTNPPTAEAKAFYGYVPSGTITTNQLEGGADCDDGCNFVLQNAAGVTTAEFSVNGMSTPPAAPGPATWMFNGIWESAAFQMNLTGQGYTLTDETAHGVVYNDWTSISSHNLIYMIAGSFWQAESTLANATFDAGAWSGAIPTATTNEPGANYVMSVVVVGSGATTFALGQADGPHTLALAPVPSMIEVVPATTVGIPGGFAGPITPGHFSGGTLTVTDALAVHVANVPLMLLGGLTSTCAWTNANSGTATVSVSDGTRVILEDIPSCAAVVYTPPTAYTASPPSLSGSNGSASSGPVPMSVTLADPEGLATSGEGTVTVTDQSGGTVVFDGVTATSVSMLGRPSDILAALAAFAVNVGSSGSDNIAVTYQNQGTQAAAWAGTATSGQVASTSVSCAPGALTAPLAPSAFVCPIGVLPADWTGTLSLSGPASADFAISGSNLITSSTPPPAGTAQVTITATP